ncbi:22.3 kDa class VI heat shock protein isoform X1 [Iris pallida]|uniref:22.3 kDa class VI heat shock protein isoform X1 n=1 Tax=Iris pallida TaxID=29817 RepID=A0AAX6DHF2_IRIPA|nr:22.3 kDa class VI heat shock protein isoform X1 [Iris pallida]KAJ6842425.1 22.3 kDa class VI heat shock protein isoform X1 [Iris pallida]
MPPRRALEVQSDDRNPQKWHVSLTEDAFNAFLAGRGGGDDAARAVFGEGSLFSPLLFGKFFDPADAFPLWEFESGALLSGVHGASKTSVDWMETDAHYVLRAELPEGARKIKVELCGDKGKLLEISGQWRGKESDARDDWRTGRWWERGFVRRIELPDNANCRKVEAHIDDDVSLEIKIPKNSPEQCSPD